MKRYKHEDLEFQDFVIGVLWRDGFGTYLNGSRFKQLTEGEGPTVEIKHDKKRRETGNFYIETSERRVGNLEYTPSGIHRGDKTWLWAIGDMDELFIVAKTWLLFSEGHCQKTEANHPGDTPTKGFLLPADKARKHAARRYVNGRAVNG